MPPKRSKRVVKQRKNTGSLGRSVFAAGAIVTARQPSFKVQQGTSGVGAITSNLTGASLTNASNIRLSPFAIGSRFGLFANLYAQWRVRRMVVQYIPDETASGVLDQPQGAITASVSYGNRAFAMGWNKDPSITLATADNVVEAGGQDCNTTRGKTLVLPASGWLWTSSTSASPSAIDERVSAHGQLSIIFRQTSTTTATTYGRVDISAEVEFRYPENASIVGLDTTQSKDDEKTSLSPPPNVGVDLDLRSLAKGPPVSNSVGVPSEYVYVRKVKSAK